MTDAEKLELYRNTLESIVILGHFTQSYKVEDVLSHVTKKAWSALDKAGDIYAED